MFCTGSVYTGTHTFFFPSPRLSSAPPPLRAIRGCWGPRFCGLWCQGPPPTRGLGGRAVQGETPRAPPRRPWEGSGRSIPRADLPGREGARRRTIAATSSGGAVLSRGRQRGGALGRRDPARAVPRPGEPTGPRPRRQRAPAESHGAAASAWPCGTVGGSQEGPGSGAQASAPGERGAGSGRGRDGKALPLRAAPRLQVQFGAGNGAAHGDNSERRCRDGDPGGTLIPGNVIPQGPGRPAPPSPEPRTQRRPSPGFAEAALLGLAAGEGGRGRGGPRPADPALENPR